MKTVTNLCALAFLVGSISTIDSAAHARPAYVGRVPTTFSCSTCHIDNRPKSVRNSFGIDFLQAGLSWDSICNNDSDMDSFSNGVELNDPNCTWVRGQAAPAGPQSNPGDESSTPMVEPPPEPTCDDQIQNGDESDLDCGGPDCPACPDGSMCNVANDCAETSDCVGGVCQEAAMAGEMVMAGEMAGEMVMAGEMAGEMVMAGEMAGEMIMAGEMAGESVMAGEMVMAGEVVMAGDMAGEPVSAGEMEEAGVDMVDDMDNSVAQDDGGCITSAKTSANSSILILLLLVLGVRRHHKQRANAV